MDIGDRVRVIDQEITGKIIGYDWGNKVIVLEDNPEWTDGEEEGTLVFSKSDLELI